VSADGRPVPLAEQDRGLWDAALVAEGVAVLDEALLRHSPGSYQLQAAIAALHGTAGSFESTDWAQIALLYGALARLEPSPIVEVNRAVAVGMADGGLAGLAVLAPVVASGALDQYGPLHAAHGFLLEKAGYAERARGAWARAAETAGNSAVRDELLRRHSDPL
jgi:RNA polymerase sigma-70 factor (ECF subfamily)